MLKKQICVTRPQCVNKRFFTGGQDTLFACPNSSLLLISESLPQYIKFETSSDSDACLYSTSRSLDTYEFYDRHSPISQYCTLIYMRNRCTCVHFTATFVPRYWNKRCNLYNFVFMGKGNPLFSRSG